MDLASEFGGSCSADIRFNRVSTDSRTIEPGDLFVALSGDHYHGNAFVVEAYQRGACAVVVSQPIDCAVAQWLVDDVSVAYGAIGAANRRLFKGRVIALTGSAGKTSCKEMVAAILAESGSVLSTSANYNNEVGVPKTLLAIESKHRFAVIEMGARQVGDIAYLTTLVAPDIALLTNALAVHIESFGDIDTVASTKGELFAGLAPARLAIVNKDDAYYTQWLALLSDAKVLSFSLSDNTADCYAANIRVDSNGGTEFELQLPEHRFTVSLKLLGKHNVGNAVAASAAALGAGASAKQIKRALENITPVAGRLQSIVLPQMTIIDDSYNASPDSVRAAIDVLAGFPGRRALVLGTMGELGEHAQAIHQQVAHYAAEQGIDQLLAVGPFSSALLAGFGDGASGFDSMESLLASIDSLTSCDYVLVKGSRTAGMERAVAGLIGAAEKVAG